MRFSGSKKSNYSTNYNEMSPYIRNYNKKKKEAKRQNEISEYNRSAKEHKRKSVAIMQIENRVQDLAGL